LAAADCAGDKPICDGTTRTCRGCTAAADCPGATPVCVASGACHECSAGNIGACAAPKGLCDPTTDRCVGCVSAATCPGDKPVCDGGTKVCRGCGGDGECGGTTPACLPSGACAECSATNRSACPAARSVCDVAGGGVCVGCLTNSDCAGPTPFCSPATHACVPCTASGAPSCPDPARPVCQTTGPLAGACTECTPTNDALCVGAKPRCVASVGLCGCSDVNGDGDCGGPTSGKICNGPVGICVPGCSAAPLRNGCPVGQTCSDVTGAVGSCGPAGGCVVNGDCVAPTTACDTGVTPHQCVQCLSDAGCLLPQVCSPTTHACVECTPTSSTACVSSGSGAQCLAGGTCGCQGDTDCGGVASGRICDATVHKCTIGCRATGGNGCPVGLSCSSADATPGHCGPPVDGGSDGAAGDGSSDRGGDGSIPDGGGDGRDSASDGMTADRAADGPGADRLADGNTGEGSGSRDGVSADGANGGDGGDTTSGRDGALADGSGQLSDGRNDQAYGDAAIGTRVLNLAGGGCQCGIGPTSATTGWQATSAAFSLLALTLIARRRRRH
ncbi:MAG TPA: hypothetical protein VNO55_23860, partial [Polyangia bacterium]|nr:hypothetical protein [Polyangia bacterium]